MRAVRGMKNNVPPSGPGVKKQASVPRFLQYQFNDINPANTTVYWVGLAISYSETVTMTLNGSTLTGPLGSAPWNDGLFQELNQSIIGTKESGDAYVPGS